MIKRKRLIVSVVTMALLFGLMPYVLSTKPISKAADHGLSNPRVAQDNTVTWDCVYFGNYWQNDTNGDGKADQNDEKEPIKWRILSVDGDDAFLLSDKGLDVKPYNEYNDKMEFATWEKCTLRAWLSDSFYNAAFTDKEKDEIIETKSVSLDVFGEYGVLDKVSILSNIEAVNAAYGFHYDNIESETREVKVTAYAKANGALTSTRNGCSIWWLRTHDEFFEKNYIADVFGSVEALGSFAFEGKAIRPCIHINLVSDTWSKADTVTATGGSFVTPTPTATATPTATPKPTPTQKVTSTPTQKVTVTPTATPTATPDNRQNSIPTLLPEPSIQPKESPKVINEPKTIAAPSKVKGLSAKNKKKKSVTLSWKMVKDADGYQIQYASDTFAKKKVKNTKKTKFTIKKLKKKKTYSFRVRAYKMNKGVKFCGNWCKAKKVKIKK